MSLFCSIRIQKSTMSIILVVWLLLLFSSILTAQEMLINEKPQFKFKDLSDDILLGGGGLIQDKQGFIWIVAVGGLYKFDGIEYQVFEKTSDEHSLLDNGIYDIFIDSTGFIWIAYSSGSISRLDPKTERFNHIPSISDNKSMNSNDTLRGLLDGNYAYSMAEDAYGGIWFGTETGLYKVFAKESGKLSLQAIKNTPFDDQTILSLTADEEGRLWVGSLNGLYYIEYKRGENTDKNRASSYRFKTIKLIDKGKNNSILALMVSKDNKLWLSTIYDGLFTVDLQTLKVEEQFKQQKNWSVTLTYSILQDAKGKIWFATTQGLGMLERGNKEIFFYQHDPSISTSIKDNTVFDVLIDLQNNIWLVTSSAVQILSPDSALFKNYQINKYIKGAIKEKEIGFIHFDKKNTLWLGGVNTGLYREENKDLSGRNFINFQDDESSIFMFETPDLLSFLIDSTGRYWFGTRRNGIIKISPDDLGALSVKQHYPLLSKHPGSLNSSVYNNVLYEDGQQRIWIGNLDGLHRYDELNDSFLLAVFNDAQGEQLPTPHISSLVEFKNTLLAGSSEGELFYLEKNENNFEKVSLTIENDSLEPITDVNNMLVSEGELWLATDVGLVKGNINQNTESEISITGELYDQRHGLNDISITYVYADFTLEKNIWIATNKGISRFHIKSNKFTNFTDLGDVSAREFRNKCSAQNSTGDIYFCGDDGVIHFSPSEFTFDKQVPPEVKLTKFYLNNKLVSSVSDSLLDKSISYENEIVLTDKQADFSFDFAALDYTAPLKNQYIYMLEGVDNDWVTTTAKWRHAKYNNISAGEYIFKVKASNSQGVWNEKGTQLKIVVLPAWYLTWWAKLLWLFLVLFIFYFILRIRTQQFKLRSEKLEIAVKKRTAELEQAHKIIASQDKMSSLGTLSAGIAHEINNPTNFVYGSCQNMEADLKQVLQFLHDLAGDDADDEISTAFNEKFAPLFGHVDVISEGAQRIKKIVTGLSVFSRTDHDEMELTSIKQCIETTVELVNTEYKDITEFNLIFNDSPNVMCFPSKINQVLMNLLVNASQAIKIAKNNINKSQSKPSDYFGKITVITQKENNQCTITIKDNANGISKNNLTKIFEPFFTTKSVGEGTGLGLALSYEIIQQHSGDLTVESEEGKGATFTLTLPLTELNNNHRTKEEV